MPVVFKMKPLDKDIAIRLTGTPAQRSARFAAFARSKLSEAEAVNKSVLGHVPPHKTFVDGTEGATEDRVKPDGGVVMYEFELVSDTLVWIGDQLREHSPVGSGPDKHAGLYKDSHILYADGSEVPEGADVPQAGEYVFISALPYSRKLEHGSSPQAPDGVYQAVASLAKSRFGNVASIEFNYRAPIDGVLHGYVSPGGRHGRRGNTGPNVAHARHINDNRVPCIVVRAR